jgi:hypothetical protein
MKYFNDTLKKSEVKSWYDKHQKTYHTISFTHLHYHQALGQAILQGIIDGQHVYLNITTNRKLTQKSIKKRIATCQMLKVLIDLPLPCKAYLEGNIFDEITGYRKKYYKESVITQPSQPCTEIKHKSTYKTHRPGLILFHKLIHNPDIDLSPSPPPCDLTSDYIPSPPNSPSPNDSECSTHTPSSETDKDLELFLSIERQLHQTPKSNS